MLPWLRSYYCFVSLNKANISDTVSSFLDLFLSISNYIVSTKIYNKGDIFCF